MSSGIMKITNVESIENYVLILNYLLNNANYSIYFVGSNSEASFISKSLINQHLINHKSCK